MYELEVNYKKFNVDEGVYFIYATTKFQREANHDLISCSKTQPLNIYLCNLKDGIDKEIASNLQAMICASSTALSVTNLNLSEKLKLNSEILPPFVHHSIKDANELMIKDVNIKFHIKKASLFRNSIVNDQFRPVPANDILNTSNIHDMETQAYNIHDAITQPDVFINNEKNTLEENSDSEEIIFEAFTEDPYVIQESQNLLDDFDTEKYSESSNIKQNKSNDSINPKCAIDKKNKIKTKRFKSTFLSDDDSSTDIEDSLDIIKTEKHAIDRIKSKDLKIKQENVDIFDADTELIKPDDLKKLKSINGLENGKRTELDETLVFDSQKRVLTKKSSGKCIAILNSDKKTALNEDIDDLPPTQVFDIDLKYLKNKSDSINDIAIADIKCEKDSDKRDATQIVEKKTQGFIEKPIAINKTLNNHKLPPTLLPPPRIFDNSLRSWRSGQKNKFFGLVFEGVDKEKDIHRENKENIGKTGIKNNLYKTEYGNSYKKCDPIIDPDLSDVNLTQKLATVFETSIFNQDTMLDDDLFYDNTQEMVDDLTLTQKPIFLSPSIDHKSIKSTKSSAPKDDHCFVTPMKKNIPSKSKTSAQSSLKNNIKTSDVSSNDSSMETTPPNHYNCTQDLLADLALSQEKSDLSNGLKNSGNLPSNKLINVIHDIEQRKRNSVLDLDDDFIPNSQVEYLNTKNVLKHKTLIMTQPENDEADSINLTQQIAFLTGSEGATIKNVATPIKVVINDSTYNSDTSESSESPAKKDSKISIFDIELPNSQQIEQFVKCSKPTIIPESPIIIDSNEESEASNSPIVFKRKMPNKNRKAGDKRRTSTRKKTVPSKFENFLHHEEIEDINKKRLQMSNEPEEKTTSSSKCGKSNSKSKEKTNKNAESKKTNSRSKKSNEKPKSKEKVHDSNAKCEEKVSKNDMNHNTSSSKDDTSEGGNKNRSRKRAGESLNHDSENKRSRAVNETIGSVRNSRVCNRSLPTSYNVMFTQMESSKFDNTVNELGGKIVESDGNVLIAKQIKRTFKSLLAVSQGIPIVSTTWLTKSAQCGRFLNPFDYLLKDPDAEVKYMFELKTAIKSTQNFLSGWTVYITPKINPPPAEMKKLIEVNGGVCILEEKINKKMQKGEHQKVFTVSCPNDKKILSYLPSPHVTSEAILAGIFRQSLDLKSNLLYSK